jgi:predicted transcriptional regulator
MNPKKSLKSLVVSQTRLKLIKEFFTFPREAFYIRELTRKTVEKINSVRRELINLEEVGILYSERRGNRLFYIPNSHHPLFYPLLLMANKSFGLGYDLQKNKARLGNIKLALFSTRFMRWESVDNEVDILIVGRVVLPEIGEIIRHEEKRRDREINYAVLSLDEYKMRVTNKDPFIIDFLLKAPAVIIGSEEDLYNI